MAQEFYIPRPDNAKRIWLDNFVNKLPAYKTKYGVADADITKLTNGLALFTYCLSALNALRVYNTAITSFKNSVAKTPAGAAVPTAFPAQPTLGTAPASLQFDVFTLATYIGGRIKSHSAFNQTDGNDLRLFCIDTGNTDNPATWQPHINALRQGDFYMVQWGWEGHPAEGADIEKDNGNGVWVHLATDIDPDFIDPQNVSSVPTPTTWKYRVIYRKNGVQVGLWSEVVVVAVP